MLVELGIVALLKVLAMARAARALAEIEALRSEVRRALAASPGSPARADSAPPEPSSPPPLAAPLAPVHPDLAVPPAAQSAAPPAAALDEDSLETRIGSRWLLYLGVGAIILATSYFVKLAFDNRWITETMRVVVGAAGGLALVGIGRRFARMGYATYGQMLAGGGIAILYLSVYAALQFYGLISRTTAFGLMIAVTAGAGRLADRERSQGLALTAVGGGFFTPFLIGGEPPSQAALFGYDLILVAGIAGLARRRVWPALDLVSYVLAAATIAGWMAVHYADPAHLRTVLFLTAFCALFLYIAARARQSPARLGRLVARVLSTSLPIYFVVSVALLATHSLALLVFLIAFTVAGIALARQAGAPWGRLLLWSAVAAPLAAWAGDRASASWLVPGATTVLAIYALHVVAQVDRLRRQPGTVAPADIWLLHANGVGTYVILHVLLEPWAAGWLGPVALGAAAWHVWLGRMLGRLHGELEAHGAVLGATLVIVALAIWLDADWVVAGWMMEAAALTALGVRFSREWLRLGGALLLAAGAARLVSLLFGPITATYAVLANPRAAVTLLALGLLYLLARLHRQHEGEATRPLARDADIFLLGAQLLSLVFVTTEINAFWELRGASRPAALARESSFAIAWLLHGLAIVRVGLTRRREWLRIAGGLVLFVPFAAITTRLWISALAGLRPPEGYVVFANAGAAAALVLIVTLYALAGMHRRAGWLAGGGATEVAVARLLASVVTLGLLSAEISAFWSLRATAAGARPDAYRFARELTLSITWAGYAAALIAAGIRHRYRPVRLFGIATFLVTVAKVAVVDLSALGQIYRVLSVAALGLLLLVASFLYQRARGRLSDDVAAGPPPVDPAAPGAT